MIGCFNCPITGVRLQPTVRLQLYRMISVNEAANAPIIFEEFVMVMINVGIQMTPSLIAILGHIRLCNHVTKCILTKLRLQIYGNVILFVRAMSKHIRLVQCVLCIHSLFISSETL